MASADTLGSVGNVGVVTGASSGIGQALAEALSARGARLVLGGRSAVRLASIASSLPAALAVAGDVRDEGHIRALITKAEAAFGPVELFVNNAGVSYAGAVAEGTTEQWRELLETNALAVFVSSREAARAMSGRKGTIVNVSSLAGCEPTPGDAVYSASKHAVHAFTRAMAAELDGTGIRFVLVEPGQTMTSIGRSLSPETLADMAAALGLNAAAVPDFQGSHAPPEFVREVLTKCPERFLDPQAVAAAIVNELDSSTDSRVLRIQPGSSVRVTSKAMSLG